MYLLYTNTNEFIIPNIFTFAAKSAIYNVSIAKVIFSHVKITRYFTREFKLWSLFQLYFKVYLNCISQQRQVIPSISNVFYALNMI